jgi:hypothetical protein
MMKRSLALGVVILASVVIALPAAEPPPPKEPLAIRVAAAIKKGREFLIDKQELAGDGKGHWELDVTSKRHEGGWTSLATLALLYAGEKPDSAVIQRALKYIRAIEPDDTYTVGLQTLVLAEVGSKDDLTLIQRNVDWLVKNKVPQGAGKLRGWGYKSNSLSADNSNTQYALLGLWAGRQAGAKVDRAIWEEIHSFYLRTQDIEAGGRGSGGWRYTEGTATTPTMSVAGLCGLIISGQELAESRLKIRDDGSVVGCGEYDDDPAMAKALDYLNRNFQIEGMRSNLFYHLYGLERAGRLTGRRYVGDYDWYRKGCEYLTSNDVQRPDGAWVLPGQGFDGWDIISTSFSLLFLSKGRTPVLISKFTHGPIGNIGTDWNTHRNDARHLAEYATKEVFKRQPLAWQVFNARDAHPQNDEDVRQLTAELLQSPILYITGHNAPVLTGQEKKLLKQYLEQGGFILAEACSNSADFDRGFRKLLMDEAVLGVDGKLEKLRSDHPIWTARAKILPKEDYPFPLEGVELGCKTVVVYCPRGYLSCLWEANQMDNKYVQMAFQLGGNIVAYATGMEVPKPKGIEVEVTDTREPAKVLRGFLKIAQVKTEGDWRAAPRAIRNLLAHVREKDKLDVALQSVELSPDDTDILKYKLLYMHGRGEFSLKERELEMLKAALDQGGGLLFADACCGKPGFNKSFQEMVGKMWPDKKLEQIPLTDDLYSQDLNGTAIKTVRCRREANSGDNGYREVAPFLEGIKVNGRWVVIYSKYDIGCALEKHQSSDCLGHDHDSALLIGSAVVRYALQR